MPENEPSTPGPPAASEPAKETVADVAPATEATGAPAPSAEPERKRDPIRWVTLIVLVFCVAVFAWRVAADRFTPYTDQARVKALIVPITPRVSGYLTEIHVRLHSVVEEGDVLFQLDRRPYEAAVAAAEAGLDNATQTVGARSAAVKSAAAKVGVARAQLDRAQRSSDRTKRIREDNPGALSQADVDRTETSLTQSIEKLSSAEADLERAQKELGPEGADNPQVRAAVAGLEQAQLDLAFTTILAPSRGVIESFNLDVGHYAVANQPLTTFVSSHDVWIQADMTENNISLIGAGARVELVLDVAPGRVFDGEVRSIGYGVSAGSALVRGDLPTVEGSAGWLRDPQRFPVIIGVVGPDAGEARKLLRSGGQVDVVVYSGDHGLLDTVGGWYLRLHAYLSYVR